MIFAEKHTLGANSGASDKRDDDSVIRHLFSHPHLPSKSHFCPARGGRGGIDTIRENRTRKTITLVSDCVFVIAHNNLSEYLLRVIHNDTGLMLSHHRRPTASPAEELEVTSGYRGLGGVNGCTVGDLLCSCLVDSHQNCPPPSPPSPISATDPYQYLIKMSIFLKKKKRKQKKHINNYFVLLFLL